MGAIGSSRVLWLACSYRRQRLCRPVRRESLCARNRWRPDSSCPWVSNHRSCRWSRCLYCRGRCKCPVQTGRVVMVERTPRSRILRQRWRLSCRVLFHKFSNQHRTGSYIVNRTISARCPLLFAGGHTGPPLLPGCSPLTTSCPLIHALCRLPAASRRLIVHQRNIFVERPGRFQ
jgi:hypothetical protein